MGVYINPTDGSSKEDFLNSNGRPIPSPRDVRTDELPVCWVHNGPFTAAGVAYDEREVNAFSQPDDRRPKRWYAVPTRLLTQFMPDWVREKLGIPGGD